MGELFKIVLLGAIQGVTEFLPVSSSGHLVLSKHFLGFPSHGAFMEVVLHTGTLVSIGIVYRRRIADLAFGVWRREAESLRYVALLIAATVPTAVGYLLLRDGLAVCYESPRVAAGALCATGLYLLYPIRQRTAGDGRIRGRSAWLVGLAQALAMLPGVSRSGATIVTARRLGIAPDRAAEFSFIAIKPGRYELHIPGARGDSQRVQISIQ